MRWIAAAVTASVWLSLWSSPARAQSLNSVVLKAPFEFTIRGKQFPPGTYTIVQRAGFLLALRDSRGRNVADLLTYPVESRQVPAATKVVFFEHDGVHLLASIWWRGRVTGQELVKPGSEAELARQVITQRLSAQAKVRH